eukprot:350193-Chlamydomonas_euryale.AAC.5
MTRQDATGRPRTPPWRGAVCRVVEAPASSDPPNFRLLVGPSGCSKLLGGSTGISKARDRAVRKHNARDGCPTQLFSIVGRSSIG